MALGRRTRKRLLILGALALGLAAALSAAYVVRGWQRARVAKEALAAGIAAQQAGDHETAVRKLGHYIRVAPEDGEALLAAAISRSRVPLPNDRHVVMAAVLARRAADAMPTNKEAASLFLDMTARTGDQTSILLAADRLLRLEPRSAEALIAKAQALAQTGKVDEAFAAVDALIEADPSNAEANRARLELMQIANRRPAEIREFADKAAAAHPESMEFALLQVQARAMAGDMDAAKEAAARASALPAENAAQVAALLRTLDLLGMHADADRLIEAGVSGPAGSDVLAAGAERAWKHADPDAARRLLLAAPKAAEADKALGWAAFLVAGEAGAAAADALRARETPEAKAWSLVLDARAAVTARDWPGARKKLQEAIDLGPSRPGQRLSSFAPAQAMLGDVETRLGEGAAAIERWRALAAGDPKWLTVRLSLASQLLAEGRLDEAANEAASLWSQWRDRLGPLMAFCRTATALVEAGRAPAGMSAWLIENLPMIGGAETPDGAAHQMKGQASAMLARALAATGDAPGAQREVDRFVSGEMSAPAPDLLSLAEMCRRRGLKGADALGALAAKAGEGDPQTIFVAAMQAAASGRVDEGASMLRGAAATAPPDRKREFDRGLALYLDAQGDPAGLEMLRKAAASRPDEASAQIDLLNAQGLWTDEQAVRVSIERLRSIVGDHSTRWRVFEARRLLTFEPTPAKAASVVQPELLGAVIRDDPTNVPALLLCADASLRVEPPSRDKAIEYLSRAVAASPDQHPVAVRLIALLQEQGRAEQAAARLRDLTRKDGLSDDLRRQRAELLLRQAMWAEAQTDLEWLAREGESAPLARLASVKAMRGDTAGARDTLERALAAQPPAPEAFAFSADFYARMGDFDRAMASANRAGPGGAPAPGLVAIVHERAGRLKEAEDVLSGRATAENTASAWLDLAAFLVRRERMPEASKAVERGLARAPDNPELKRLERALAFASGEDGGTIMRALDERDAGPVERMLGALQWKKENPKDATGLMDRLSAVRDEFPSFLPIRRQIAMELLSRGDTPGAVREAVSAATAMPASAEAAELATQILVSAGRGEEALTMAREWRNRALQDPYKAELAAADLEMSAGRASAALTLLEPWRTRLIADAEASPDPLALYARTLAALGREREAHDLVAPRAEKDVRWAATYASIGRLLVSRPAEAAAWMDRARALVKDDPGGRLVLAQAHWDLATASTPTDAAQASAVIAIIRGLETRKETRGPAALLLAVANEALRDDAEAERCYQIAVEAMPEEPLALNNFAYLLIRRDRAKDALPLAMRAVAAARKPGASGPLHAFLDTLGLAQIRTGAYEQAAGTFAEALEASPADRGLLLGLCEAYLLQGRMDDARATMGRYQALSDASPALPPDSVPRLEEVRRRLTSAP